MSTAERAREFALLRLVGAGKRQIGTMIRAETLITVAFGLAVGSLIALPGLALFSRELTGSAVPSGPFWIYGALVSLFAALAFAAEQRLDSSGAAHGSRQGDGRAPVKAT